MTRSDLAQAVYERHGGITREEAGELVDTIIRALFDSFKTDGRVLISGFGSLRVLNRRTKKGVNPRTGREITIPGRRTVAFRPARGLVKTINERD